MHFESTRREAAVDWMTNNLTRELEEIDGIQYTNSRSFKRFRIYNIREGLYLANGPNLDVAYNEYPCLSKYGTIWALKPCVAMKVQILDPYARPLITDHCKDKEGIRPVYIGLKPVAGNDTMSKWTLAGSGGVFTITNSSLVTMHTSELYR